MTALANNCQSKAIQETAISVTVGFWPLPRAEGLGEGLESAWPSCFKNLVRKKSSTYPRSLSSVQECCLIELEMRQEHNLSKKQTQKGRNHARSRSMSDLRAGDSLTLRFCRADVG